MKKRIIAVIVILAVLVALFFIGTGFQKRMDVVLVDYSVSEDGTEITLDVGIPTSSGYIRGFKDNGGGVKPHYLTFFSTFGGINSPIGAEHSFQLELTSDDTKIYFNRPEGGYELILVKDEETGQWLRPSGIGEENNTIFEATILEIRDNYFLVEPVEGSQELNNADLITVPMKNIGTAPQPNVGDIIEIAYNGEIAESYPAQITEVYGIKVVKEAEQWDLIPMVMVNGELYIDTGHESTVEARCGVMDGEITSEVDGSEKPTKDNQSNFGTGYGYQYGSQEGIIEINMNEKWWVFATEKVLASSELMIDPVAVVSIHNVFTGENANITENEDIRTISNILCGDAWNTEGTTDCLSNIEITINEETYKYHSDCGTFNDNVNQNYLSLDDERKIVVNAIFAEYISLTATEVPAE